MEGRIETLLSTILVVCTLCATTLLRPGLAEIQSTPRFPGSPIDLTKCWSSLINIQGCHVEIIKSILTGKFENVGPTCCKAFTEVDAKCWPKMFPLNPLFPPLLKDGCSRIISGAPAHTTPQFPFIPGSPIDLTKCLSSLVNVEGCVSEIHKSVFTGKFGKVGPMCCKAFSAVDAKCWPQMFPFNPFFPPLLKNECSRIKAATPTHK
ncbi:Prolamin-like domain [Arabidopsis thaliana x Arabidopsis arenosa]|uniref:Prolamin-like domain n=1 Tax=Arabidopsis thaliana x Arabidopsis arenosa TaxID=1240361 RepID=A0A8T1XHU3_9BRAS|nr:Prolamin-like domain [Arabidopsis thaliana x Arabidopsis arenosa]